MCETGRTNISQKDGYEEVSLTNGQLEVQTFNLVTLLWSWANIGLSVQAYQLKWAWTEYTSIT